ncbi:phosphoadenylyl-sulfate reductase [Parvularcula lutaonensis]|uniref:Adenosine 5'-phosphosulfate reductase n=1 Tax=Parvularcula lutaonensis TaxID=491923 RepID=A0ABV7MCF9_9PROT|nr:phosphoadenylyl-sulfate reductase [Parvularcula lutaonensis]GGY46758.1 phosphoadenylyl-sulfate reductase (thioredoxin) [Parvularcula lutaonensis]
MTAAVLKLRGETAPEDRARALSAEYADADAQAILERAIREEFAGEIALVSSFGAESAVLLHLVASVAPETPVIFLDTQKHFAQTLSYRRKLAARLGLTDVRDILPDTEEAAAQDPNGDLWRRDTDACCDLRKVRPLKTALDGFGSWITGRKAFHGGERMHLPAFEWNGRHFKVNPLVRWTPEDVAEYRARHDLPAHPLVEQGYPSIGCWPCTRAVEDGEGVRAGRWSNSDKAECGIHVR